jgi:3-oxoacyl-[acyl-carrier protein] reductase
MRSWDSPRFFPVSMFSTIAIQRYAKLEEVAAGVVFLASPAASYITGAVIDIEGGYSA